VPYSQAAYSNSLTSHLSRVHLTRSSPARTRREAPPLAEEWYLVGCDADGPLAVGGLRVPVRGGVAVAGLWPIGDRRSESQSHRHRPVARRAAVNTQ
jgi:hypothetical protein